jgi:hypothetical protein
VGKLVKLQGAFAVSPNVIVLCTKHQKELILLTSISTKTLLLAENESHYMDNSRNGGFYVMLRQKRKIDKMFPLTLFFTRIGK